MLPCQVKENCIPGTCGIVEERVLSHFQNFGIDLVERYRVLLHPYCTDGTLVMQGTLISSTQQTVLGCLLYDCPIQRTIRDEKSITLLLDIRGVMYGMRLFSGVKYTTSKTGQTAVSRFHRTVGGNAGFIRHF